MVQCGFVGYDKDDDALIAPTCGLLGAYYGYVRYCQMWLVSPATPVTGDLNLGASLLAPLSWRSCCCTTRSQLDQHDFATVAELLAVFLASQTQGPRLQLEKKLSNLRKLRK